MESLVKKAGGLTKVKVQDTIQGTDDDLSWLSALDYSGLYSQDYRRMFRGCQEIDVSFLKKLSDDTQKIEKSV